MWYLPVTTEPAKALGVDVWGFPKAVADITHADNGRTRETTVTVDGEQVITLNVRKPPSVPVRLDGYSYTVLDGELQHVSIDVDAAVGGWPLSDSVSVTLGDHPRAESLRRLDLGDRAVSRISLEGQVRFHPPQSLSME